MNNEKALTSFFKEFSGHREHIFLEYNKDSTDALLAKKANFFWASFPKWVI